MNLAEQVRQEIFTKKKNLFNSFLNQSTYNFKNFKRFKKFKTVVLIGMGGSILGAKAIYYFLKHKINKKFIFIDNLDESNLRKIKSENKLRNALFMIVSKSGNTSETILNAGYFKSFFSKSNVIVMSENKNNVLREFAKHNNYCFVDHNPYIGGRYSVFSEVGMLPAYLMGLNPKSFKKDIPKIIKSKKNLNKIIKDIKKINLTNTKILILFNYVPELNDFLFWCQQLMAESLGKKKKGFLPVISHSPKDHHSLLQLYLGGPNNKVFYIFHSTKDNNLKINLKSFGLNINYLSQKSYQKIKNAQKNAFVKILGNKKIRYKEINIKNFNEKVLGRLFFIFIFKTIALGKLMKVNPFDQPAVESVKVLTKKFLKLK